MEDIMYSVADPEDIRAVAEATAINNFPNFVLRDNMENGVTEYMKEMRKIVIDYYNYEKGVEFFPEGSKGDYIPSNVKFKIVKSLIDKEARFMFSHVPDINVVARNVSEEDKQIESLYREIISEIVDRTGFSGNLLKATKDCLVGRRVACVVDFSEQSGVGIHFYDSLHFYYETSYSGDVLTKFVSFEEVSETKNTKNKMYLVNKYERDKNIVYMSSVLHDSSGKELETLIPWGKIALDYIPAKVIFNVGLLKNKKGISDCEDITQYEQGYNRIGNADIDSERQGMNPVTVFIDINHETTKDLSSSPGSVWDLESSQLLNEPHPNVLKLAPQLGHTEAVKTTLDRLRSAAYSQLDIPDITADGVLSGVTSYKAVRSLYFPLSTRCDEKMQVWKPAIAFIFKTALDFCFLNVKLTKQIYEVDDFKKIRFKIEVVENYALLADEVEEKQLDIDEINTNARSRRSYLQKWRNEEFKTDEQVEEELEQIAVEQNMMDVLSMNTHVQRKMEKQDEEEEIEDQLEDVNNE